MKKFFVFLFIIMIIVSGCKSQRTPEQGLTDNENKDNGKTNHSKVTITPTLSLTPEHDPVKIKLDNMTVTEKIGQLFIVSLRSSNDSESILSIDDSIKEMMEKYKIAGVILFAENINSIPQTSKLIEDMQNISCIPLFFAVDEEGGLVSRITKSPQMHATVFPNNSVIGQTQNPEIAEQVAHAIAEEISSLGFNMNFAPVADINTNPQNPVIGVRSYGNNAEMVSQMVAAAVIGIQNESVSAVLKHFPGHGDTSTDSHYGAASVSHDKERLFNTELLPFIAGIENGADAIMTAHILTPEIPGENVPATLKPEILTDILRNELAFKGLIITDALNMGAITEHFTSEQAAVKAILAGADILLMPQDLDKAFLGVKKACEEGIISTQRLDESVERILRTKYKIGLFDETVREDPEKVLGCTEHRELVESIVNK